MLATIKKKGRQGVTVGNEGQQRGARATSPTWGRCNSWGNEGKLACSGEQEGEKREGPWGINFLQRSPSFYHGTEGGQAKLIEKGRTISIEGGGESPSPALIGCPICCIEEKGGGENAREGKREKKKEVFLREIKKEKRFPSGLVHSL